LGASQTETKVMTAKKANQVVTLEPVAGSEMSVHPGTMIQALMKLPDIDIEKMTGMFELQKKYDDEIARKAYHTAKAQFSALAETIKYDRDVDFNSRAGDKTEYSYATLAGTMDQIRKALSDCGLQVSWKLSDLDAGIRVTCFLTHSLGYQEETSLSAARDAGKGATGMNTLQAVKSTVSYLERITLYALLGLASRGDDDDGRSADQFPDAEKITAAQAKSITAKISKVGAETKKILDLFKVDAVKDLTTDQYQPVHALLAAKAVADKNKEATK